MLSLLSGLAQAQDAASLHARHAALSGPLSSNAFRRPLVLEASEKSGNLAGDIYAQMAQPYAVLAPALKSIDHWCDILILHLNVKSCRVSRQPAGDLLKLSIGAKSDQPLEDAYRIDFAYKLATAYPDYLRVLLEAEAGPMGTSGYRIVVEAVPLDAQRSFLHLSYSYAVGITARIALQTYLATIGRDKVGFSVIGRRANDQRIYQGGMRGLIERNTMRYYLAIEAYLGALSLQPAQQLEKRLSDWHASVERYPLQLHELERDEYLEMKRREFARDQALGSTTAAN